LTAVPDGNEEDNPNANGRSAASETLLERTVRGVPIKVSKTQAGTIRATAFGIPLRGVLRWMGSRGWTTDEAQRCLDALLTDWTNGSEYAASLIEEGHIGSGKDGDEGCFGRVPEITKEFTQALNDLREEKRTVQDSWA
jgi:hypothetical protein